MFQIRTSESLNNNMSDVHSPMKLQLQPKQQNFFKILVITLLVSSAESTGQIFRSIISFGDSIADTGNNLLLSRPNHLPHSAFPPYGQTFFHRPTGRCSDGRLIIDFIAQFFGIPLVPPFFEGKSSNQKSFEGVNFAVVGATALDPAFFEEKGVIFSATNISLGVQLKLFRDLLPSLCSSSSDCDELFSSSLILMGEIGGNDYNYAFFQKKNIQDIREFVPVVVNAISSAIKELIELGAVTILVPGNFPIGCCTAYLAIYEKSKTEEYDLLTGCINWLNDFAQYHNEILQSELIRLQKLYPRAKIIYADYYNPTLELYKHPDRYGFMKRPLKACCGEGGAYDFSFAKECGEGDVRHCEDPSLYLNWDGIHFTEAAYKSIAKAVLQTSFGLHPISSSTSSIAYTSG